jgi:hypothetical protein
MNCEPFIRAIAKNQSYFNAYMHHVADGLQSFTAKRYVTSLSLFLFDSVTSMPFSIYDFVIYQASECKVVKLVTEIVEPGNAQNSLLKIILKDN